MSNVLKRRYGSMILLVLMFFNVPIWLCMILVGAIATWLLAGLE